jgi:hypothetical protein
VRLNVGVTICKKFPTKAEMVITADNRQEVAMFRHAVLVVADFATLFEGTEVFFLFK